ncbi:class I SAM-dependent methyltransferase [Wenyingzhuangia sp. 2_MG-2023]|uniref:class I SAM-dependent methyltransferase n=1 Tax=Wenyingzhuangia sp. 2_MG-2023 TaxID=3062639 RepID=UPI0026E31C9A|nr:class I SAM-dependent methyltransferase [Wenyingzhuangia sp. 2_MG-2023]MDO6739238.1 class I SAM-dependent methyltransferase [Wenyingzhuangia sp. 2_MG-2023]
MKKKDLISRDIDVFYTKASEETRLEKGMGIFEFERIKELILKYIAKPNAKIIDVGGGTGKYSEWLAKQGHEVYMVEPVEKHLKIAQKRADKLKNKFAVIAGEAQHLDFKNNFADLVIIHGPLYHLQKKEDRLEAIAEAKRVLKKDGIILGFAINHAASTIVGLLQGLIHKKPFFDMCKEELTTGIHLPPNEYPWLLAEAYYHKPTELKQEFLSQDLQLINLVAVEGITWLDKDYFANMLHKKNQKNLAELTKITENNEELLAFSPHMMLVAKK